MSVSEWLVLLVSFLGLCWLAERFYFSRQRKAQVKQALEQFDQQMLAQGNAVAGADVDQLRNNLKERLSLRPWWLEFTAGLFPILFVVLLLRSFAYEPFRIPSNSMQPTLMTNDFILVNKFTYGLRLPVTHTKILEVGEPARGDILVFRHPFIRPTVDFIKRVVALPGDKIEFNLDKQLTINGKRVELQDAGRFIDVGEGGSSSVYAQFKEPLGNGREHLLIHHPDRMASVRPAGTFLGKEFCEFLSDRMICTVPKGHYFVMGDNRDDSLDSRSWGFVPEQNIVGRAFFIWFHWFGNFGRLGSIQ